MEDGFPVVPCNQNWSINFQQYYAGTFSLKSPKLDYLGVGNTNTYRGSAQLRLCSDFPGGQFTFQVFPGAVRPFDRLVILDNGVRAFEVRDAQNIGEQWIQAPPIPYILSKGPHQIEFQYEYNPFNLPLATVPANPNRDGGVWIDNVLIAPNPS